MMSKPLCILICDSFKAETDMLGVKFPGLVVKSFPCRCGSPGLCREEIESAINGAEKYSDIHIFGSICLNALHRYNTYVTHCFDFCSNIIVIKEIVIEEVLNGAYTVTSGWLADWRGHLEQWGFDQDTAVDFFHETASSITLFDTGGTATSDEDLAEFTNFIKLPSKKIHVGAELLKLRISAVISEWRETKEHARELENHKFI